MNPKPWSLAGQCWAIRGPAESILYFAGGSADAKNARVSESVWSLRSVDYCSRFENRMSLSALLRLKVPGLFEAVAWR